MGKGGSVSKIQVPWQLTQAIQQEAQIAQRQQQFGEEMFQYGKGRTEKYADPILNEFLRIMGGGTGTSGPTTATGGAQGLDVTKTAAAPASFTGPLSSSLYQLPVWQSQQAFDATARNIKATVPPGPQQSALLTQASNQRMQALGASAYSTVNNMLNALLGQSGEVWKGAQAETQNLAGAASSTAAAGSMAGKIADIQAMNQQLELQAKQSGNALLGGIFKSIGTLGGFALGGFAGSKAGSELISSWFG